MVYFSGLSSIIESIYLDENLNDKIGSSKIFINPKNISYLTGKVIIINELNYPEKNIETLIKNNCKIISRIKLDNSPNIEFQPYILRVCFGIRWNGITIELPEETKEMIDTILDNCSYMSDKKILLFPKLVGDNVNKIATDDSENLTGIGWALQQSGINICKTETPFIDLDIIKTKKMNFN